MHKVKEEAYIIAQKVYDYKYWDCHTLNVIRQEIEFMHMLRVKC